VHRALLSLYFVSFTEHYIDNMFKVLVLTIICGAANAIPPHHQFALSEDAAVQKFGGLIEQLLEVFQEGEKAKDAR